MPTAFSIDRPISMCTFTFADGRHCRTPRSASHQHLCTYHARKESQARAAQKLGNDIAFDLSGETTTANDLTAALCHLFTAVAQGHVKPKTANTLAYLGQTLVQSIQLAKLEFIETFGARGWHAEVEGHLYPPKPSKPQPPPEPEPEPEPTAELEAGPGLEPAIPPDSEPHPGPAPASDSEQHPEPSAVPEREQTSEPQIVTQPAPQTEPQASSEAALDPVVSNQTG